MSIFNICGRDCQFPRISFAVLQNYQPTPRTYLIAWRGNEATLNIAMTSLLHAAFFIGGMERPPYLAEEGEGYHIYLLENPSQSILANLQWWLAALFPAHCQLTQPYKIERDKALLELDQLGKDIDFELRHREFMSRYKLEGGR